MPRHIRKGDNVIITAGNEKGATGEVLRVLPDKDRVVVQGVNIRVKHLRPTQANPKGGILRREMPIHLSNVSPVVDGMPTRVRFETKPDGSKVRVAARNGAELHTLYAPRETTTKKAPAAKGEAKKPAASKTGKKKTTTKKKAAKAASE
jgi:large subunit ribosomal protein L24